MSQHDAPERARIAVVTGASSGLGLVTARELAKIGCEVVMVCRDVERGNAARAVVAETATGPAPVLMIADLSSQQSVRDVAQQIIRRYDHIDVLINNAGASFSTRELTADGIERTLAVNHLASFLLTNLLLGPLERAPAARVIMVSSETHSGRLDFANLQGEKRYNFFTAYARSKLANVLFAYELARRVSHTGVTVNALSPGPAKTHFGDNMSGGPRLFSSLMKRTPLFKSSEEAARTSIYLATSPEVEGVSGRFYMHSRERRSKRITRDLDVAARLWDISASLTGLSTSTTSQQPVAA